MAVERVSHYAIAAPAGYTVLAPFFMDHFEFYGRCYFKKTAVVFTSQASSVYLLRLVRPQWPGQVLKKQTNLNQNRAETDDYRVNRQTG